MLNFKMADCLLCESSIYATRQGFFMCLCGIRPYLKYGKDIDLSVPIYILNDMLYQNIVLDFVVKNKYKLKSNFDNLTQQISAMTNKAPENVILDKRRELASIENKLKLVIELEQGKRNVIAFDKLLSHPYLGCIVCNL